MKLCICISHISRDTEARFFCSPSDLAGPGWWRDLMFFFAVAPPNSSFHWGVFTLTTDSNDSTDEVSDFHEFFSQPVW